ncbi:aldehyde dehydrogenase family protein [Lysinibacillus irui]|uniref:Aldehyde dehydrogenase family protein n=1 Tax=Lysinibacillus irui TaxID=2998077 RepID=A0AAJ5RPN4_9BACI|nr:aldehyde dehydrogenase family protein [Lysinibacillus irui]MEA0552365.1 aldehyde dehydrogenase family protein [Lysinibacillus irui]MEA0977498.1 aldehyde dehydrogenase family protein [Lysinibacillus irui]MEA1043652.1 aldehyde dehydrogenase family protein [Lysinibacillus irui]WDV08392.1 aldehyde dehydrogenase family protein [Lysinibacillus irui]
MKKIPMLINGEWVHGAALVDVRNPSTGEVIAQISNASKAQVDEAVRAARVAFESDDWRQWKAYERGQLLIELAHYIRMHAEEWSLLECRDVGKPLSQARADIEAAARYFEFYGGAADKVMGDTIPIEDGLLNAVVLEPVGITVHIVPWNYPIQITARSVAAAIATGNAVIVKSAEDTPLTTHAIAEWLADKLPKGIFQHITGLGRDVGPYLTSHPDINHITFTGSVPTGIAVMKAAAENIIPVTLELGGKSPNIVFADANIEQALEGVMRAIIQNAGQTCSAGARLIIEETVKDSFVSQLVEKFQALQVGPGEADLDMGPLLNERQFTKITGLLQQAKADGYVITGGEPLLIEGYDKGYYIQPTILDGVDSKDPLAQEEIFGPVLTVLTFSSVEEAIALANSTDYGLVAGVWSQNIDTAHFVASRVQAGQVFINNYGAAGGIQMPFGGYKKSGIGREKGFVALRNYTQMKNIAIRYAPPNQR